MGYHVTILRSVDSRLQPISLEEAREAAAKLGEWQYTDNPPRFLMRDTEGPFSIYYKGGELWSKSPETNELAAMLRLADLIGARVRGDEYETYSSPDATYNHPDDVALRKADELQSRKLLRRDYLGPSWMRVYIIGAFVLLGVLAFCIGKWFEGQ